MSVDAPYKAIVTMDIAIHEVLKTGECSGGKMSLAEMSRYGIKSEKVPVVVKGSNKYECIKNLINKIKEFHDGQ